MSSVSNINRGSRTRLLASAAVALTLASLGVWLFHFTLFPSPGVQDNRVVVCIDPGHPSETNSAMTVVNGTTELRMNWEVALKLQQVLERDRRIRVVRTRSSLYQFMRNRERALIANEAHAALSIHLHCDAGPNHGFTIYYPDRVGRSEGRIGPSPEVLSASREAAVAINTGMCTILCGLLKDRGAKGESFTKFGRLRGGLTTSIWSDVPTVTVEMVFLTNRWDAAFIRSEQGQWQMAEALAGGIKRYLAPQLKAVKISGRGRSAPPGDS